jgi:hypothetical protein
MEYLQQGLNQYVGLKGKNVNRKRIGIGPAGRLKS